MVEDESSHDGVEILGVRPDISGVVVAGDDDLVGAYLDRGPFRLSGEGIVICPLLDVLGSYLLRTHLLDDDHGLLVIAIPPDVVPLDVGIGVPCAY